MESINDYQVLNLIGQGGFASVYRAVCQTSGQEVAIKMVDKKKMNAKGMSSRVRQEVTIHSRLKHPSILQLITFFEDENYVYLVLELCEKGELGRYLRQSNAVFTESEARNIFQQVVSGLVYLHGHGIMHRDLTLANLMLTQQCNVKIGDFGLATQVQAGGQDRHVTMCGTPNFISPEVATRFGHGLETDIWGLGCLLYTLLVGTPPFDTTGVRSTLTKVVMADYSLPDGLSPEVQDLIAAMLKKNPLERIKLRDILNHPWIKSSHQQDSGINTMTTGFSSGSHSLASTGRPGPKPVQAFPLRVLPEYSEEVETNHATHQLSGGTNQHQHQHVPKQQHPNQHQQPHQLWSSDSGHPPSPPVKMKSNPQDLPAPLLPLKSKLSSLPFLAPVSRSETNRSDCSVFSSQPSIHRQYPPQTRSEEMDERSNYSAPGSVRTADGNLRGSRTSLQEVVINTEQNHHIYSQPTNQLNPPSEQYTSANRLHGGDPMAVFPDCYTSGGGYNYTSANRPNTEQQQQNYAYAKHPQYYTSTNRRPSSPVTAGNAGGGERVQIPIPTVVASTGHSQPQRPALIPVGFGPSGHRPPPQPPPLQPPQPSNANNNNGGRRIDDVVGGPLSTQRLRAIRQKTKNAVANILPNGDVCLEFIKVERGEERVIDVMQISADGQRVVVFRPGKEDRKVRSSPTPIPPGGADAIYSYTSLPEKLWKKYMYAAKYVSLVKATTPKITLYTSKAKCYLMENSPADFVAYFDSGAKVTLTDERSVKFIDANGRNHNFSYPVYSEVPSVCTLYIDHFHTCLQHCKRTEQLLGQIAGDSVESAHPPTFPVIIGRKPAWVSSSGGTAQDSAGQTSGNNSLEKENRPPQVNNLNSFKGSIFSTAPTPPSQSQPVSGRNNPITAPLTSSTGTGPARPPSSSTDRDTLCEGKGASVRSNSNVSRTLRIPDVGVARLLQDGSVQVDYKDGTALVVKTSNSRVDYYQPNPGGKGGGWRSFDHNNLAPEVKQKLSHVPHFLAQLMALGHPGMEIDR